MRALLLLSVLVVACGKEQDPPDLSKGPCIDSATLISTGTGSPSTVTCPHPKHKLETQPPSVAAKDVAVLVLCRCVHD